ncbi:MAG TPA: CDP-alcohol phosphatidyltransferase family protein [Polyangiaceae bacterium]|jgi:phosphatidylglycerophosphate synthase|nr:CDP-alcohol phosphatidyltransferase family protein [Polyangiaceae bacterium]
MTDELPPAGQSPIQAWSRGHALGMLLSVGACQSWHAAWPSAVLAAPSCLWFIAKSGRAWTPSGRFGLANAVTSLRLMLVLALTAPPAWLSTRSFVLLTVGILSLDFVDGWLARARADSSAFGAHFDMETDALLVLVVTLRLALGQGYPAWVLSAGLLRYVYVLSLWFVPGTGREAPRSLLGRYAFLILMLGLIGGLVAHGVYGSLCVGLGTLAVSISFARSFYFSHSAS